MNWIPRRLDECVQFLSGGTPNKGTPEFWDGDIPWVSSAEMTERFLNNTSLYITQAGLDAGSRLVPEGTTFAVVRGMSLAKEFRISVALRPMAFNQDVKALIPRPGFDGLFIYYSLAANADAIKNLATEAAHGTKKLEMDRLEGYRIYVPEDVETQRAVALVAHAYDDLIATNQRRIALLEDAARRLYREWFVHLRFPDHESVPVKDGVPEGWQALSLTEVADFINGFAFKPQHQQETGLPIVKIPELRDGVSSNTPRNSGVAVPARNHIDTGDVLFSWSATLLVNEWGEGPALLNQHLFKVVPKNPTHRRLIRFATEAAIPLLLGQSVGATMQHIRRSALDAYRILAPDQPVADAFAVLVDPMLDMVLNLQGHIRQLIVARNLLLPKLMSGQLDVSGIQLPEEISA